MPRKRNPDAPIKEKARLRTTAEIQLEIGKLYRRYANKQVTAAELKSRVATLTALRAGMFDPVENPASSRSPVVINVRTAAEGMIFAPGNTLLLPFDEANKAHEAYKAGDTSWQAHLEKIKPMLTLEAYANLSRVAPPGPDNVINLRPKQLTLPAPRDEARDENE